MSNEFPNPDGRPSTYSDEIAEEICARLMSGESLSRICLDESMPCKRTVCYWLADQEKYPQFFHQYVRAREIQAEIQADEMADIADDGSNDWTPKYDDEGSLTAYALNGEHVQRSKLRIETRRWNAERLLPKRYGSKQQIDHTNSDGSLSKPTIDPTKLSPGALLELEAAMLAAVNAESPESDKG